MKFCSAFLILFNILILCQLILANEVDIEEHDIDILEHGVNYKQHVSYNKITKILTIFVPQHLDIDSSTTKIHQPSLLQIMLNHDKNYCFISTSSTISPESEITASREFEENDGTMTDESAEFVGITNHINFQLEDKDIEKLPQEFQVLCHGAPVYNVTERRTQLGKDEFMHQQFFTQEDHENDQLTRFKRTIWSQCRKVDKCTPDQSYGRTCRWLICGTVVEEGRFNACGTRHEGHATDRCVRCCEEKTEVGHCRCSDVYDQPSFRRCQDKNFCYYHNTSC